LSEETFACQGQGENIEQEIKNRGDVVDFNIERTVTGGFTKPHEWR
jgi:hypothetical protein